MKILEETCSYKRKAFGQVCCRKMEKAIKDCVIRLDNSNGKVDIVFNTGYGYEIMYHDIKYCLFCGEKIE